MTQSEIYTLKKIAPLQFKICYTNIANWLGRLFKFLTVSSLLIACTGFFQTFGGYVLLGAAPNISICFAVFLMTFGIYSINKLTDIKEDAINRPERISFLKGREKQILAFSIFALLLSAALAYCNELTALLILFIPFIANCVYSSQIHPGLPRLKDIPFVKNIVVGLSWALVCTLMPAVTLKGGPLLPVASVIFLMLIKDFINSTLCDLKDVNGDRESGVKTIPIILGPEKTKRILMILNSSLLPLLLLVKGKILIIFSLLILTEYVFIFCFNESSCPTVLEFFVDGEWLLTCLLLFGLGVIG
jgi:4-hydroxybenzoate polyprenyltransferase